MVVDLAGYVMYGFEEIAQWHAESNSSIAGRQNKYFYARGDLYTFLYPSVRHNS